jgi:hypothetical protein
VPRFVVQEHQVDDHSVAHMQHEGPNVRIWDAGDYDLEKWEDDKIVFELHGNGSTGATR